MKNKLLWKEVLLIKEKWKDVIGYEGLYQVSNLGNVKRIPQLVKFYKNKYTNEKILKQQINRHGYKYVVLNDKKKSVHKLVHRLVAKAFIPNRHCYPEIDHIDTDKTNNNVNNLRWVTRKINMQNDLTVKKMEAIGLGKKKVNQYTLDGFFLKTYPSVYEAAKSIGGTRQGIYGCCLNRTKTAYGYIWKYCDN